MAAGRRTKEDALRPATRDRRVELFLAACTVVDRDYMKPLGVDRVAREVRASRRQVQRVFLEIGGTSFRTYLAKVRMREARLLLRRGMLPVREVAPAVGYRQPAQFAKAFRRHEGVPPSAVKGVA